MIVPLVRAAARLARWDDVAKPEVATTQSDSGEWCVSVVRHPKDGGKVVVCSAKDSSCSTAMLGCAVALIVHTRRTGRLATAVGYGLPLARAATKALR